MRERERRLISRVKEMWIERLPHLSLLNGVNNPGRGIWQHYSLHIYWYLFSNFIT